MEKEYYKLQRKHHKILFGIVTLILSLLQIKLALLLILSKCNPENLKCIMEDLIEEYKQLINIVLPSKYTFPVRFNHCFGRIILDWIFKDCWYKYLDKKRTAISQLSRNQFELAITRMNEWLQNQELLIVDNNDSLSYRRRFKAK